MKIKNSRIFEILKAKGIFPFTSTEASYAEAVRDAVLEEIGNPGASHDSVLFHRVAELSSKFAKNARHNWKKRHKSGRAPFFLGEMEVNLNFHFQIWLDFKLMRRIVVDVVV